MRKIPFAGIELTSQRVRGLRVTSELPGRLGIEPKKSALVWTMSGLTRDATVELVPRDQILTCERGQVEICFLLPYRLKVKLLH